MKLESGGTMDMPKAPDDDCEWGAIDIFLFSNGQQYSPPRKYHLTAEDLNWWDSTLGFLARSHYGSMHSSINLYTIDGKKVENPIEIKNGGAYVAVDPPDSFIDSGYGKYLIKATRSWEKRQSKQPSLEISTPDDEDKDVINLQIPEQNIFIRTAVKSENPERIVVQQKRVSIKRDEEKRRPISNMPNQRSTIARKINPNAVASPPSAKRIPIRKVEPPAKATKATPIKPNARTSTSGAINRTTVKTKTSSKASDPLQTTSISPRNVKDIGGKRLPLINKNVSATPKAPVKESSRVDQFIKSTDLMALSDTYENQDKEIMLMFSNTDTVSESFQGKSDNDINKQSTSKSADTNLRKAPTTIWEETQAQPVINLIPDIATHTPEDIVKYIDAISKSKSKIKLVNPTLPKPLPDSVAAKPEQIATKINEGDVVSLKLDKEVRNGEGLVWTTRMNNAPKSNSNTEVVKEQGPYVKTNEEMLEQTKSLQSVLDNEYKHICCQKHPKVVVVKCSCCDNYKQEGASINSPKCTEKSENKTYFFVLPIVSYVEKESSKHIPDIVDKGCQITASLTNVNIVYASKTTTEELMISQKKLPDPISTESTILQSEIQGVLEYAVEQEVTILGEEKQPDYVLAKRFPSQTLIPDDQPLTEYSLANDTKAKFVRDVSAQTEWCDILLEVRRHEDGHYSFHLPPIHVLKYYGF